MNEMVGYIFGSLYNSEEAIKQINKALKKQAKLNRHLVTIALVTSMYMYLNEYRYKNQNNKIKALSKEIEELKSMEGE